MRTKIKLAIVFCVLAAPSAAEDKPPVDDGLGKLSGTWKVVSTGGHGQVVKAEGSTSHDGSPLWEDTAFVIDGDRLSTTQEPVVLPQARPEIGFYFAINQSNGDYQIKLGKVDNQGPAHIDLIVDKEIVLKGIYELKDDKLRLCVVSWLACDGADVPGRAQAAAEKQRPTDFTTKDGNYVSYVLQRVEESTEEAAP